jgi:hypothetical protein
MVRQYGIGGMVHVRVVANRVKLPDLIQLPGRRVKEVELRQTINLHHRTYCTAQPQKRLVTVAVSEEIRPLTGGYCN